MPITTIPLLPAQSIIACIIGFMVRANLPVAFAIQYLSNPATAIFQLTACYFTGGLVLGQSPGTLLKNANARVEMFLQASSWREAWSDMPWKDIAVMYLGSIVLGVALGLLGYFVTHLLWRPKAAKAARKSGHSNPPLPPQA